MEMTGEHRVADARADAFHSVEGDGPLLWPEVRVPAGRLPGAAARDAAGELFYSFQQYPRPKGTLGK